MRLGDALLAEQRQVLHFFYPHAVAGISLAKCCLLPDEIFSLLLIELNHYAPFVVA